MHIVFGSGLPAFCVQRSFWSPRRLASWRRRAPRPGRFLRKPLVIEDQGSFFIGGIPKVTTCATTPPPNAPNQAPSP